MPAINPARLEKEIEAIVKLMDDPGEFRRQCLELLRFYADRTKRTLDSAGSAGSQRFVAKRRTGSPDISSRDAGGAGEG
jgi:hypothetical protein